jgi:hypothetical protein
MKFELESILMYLVGTVLFMTVIISLRLTVDIIWVSKWIQSKCKKGKREQLSMKFLHIMGMVPLRTA